MRRLKYWDLPYKTNIVPNTNINRHTRTHARTHAHAHSHTHTHTNTNTLTLKKTYRFLKISDILLQQFYP